MPATRRTRRSETARVGGESQSVVRGLAADTEATRSDVKESQKVGSSTPTSVHARNTSKGGSSICANDEFAIRHIQGKQRCKLQRAQGLEKKNPQQRRLKRSKKQPTPAADCFPSTASSSPAPITDSSTPSTERLIPMTRPRKAHLKAICSKNGASRVANRRGVPARKASNPVCDADNRRTISSNSSPSLYTPPTSSVPSSPATQPGGPWRGSRPFPPRAQLPAVDDTQRTLCPVPKVSRPTTKLRSSPQSPARQCEAAITARLTLMVTDAAGGRKPSVESAPSGNQANDGQQALPALQALHGHASASQCLYDLTPMITGHITSASGPDCVQPGAYSYNIDIPPPTPSTPLNRSLILPALRVYGPGLGAPPLQQYGPFIHDTGYSDVWTARQDSFLPTASAAPRFVRYIPYTPPPDTPLMPALPRAPPPSAAGSWYHARDPASSLERAVGNGDWANAWAAEYLFGAAVSPSASTATMLPPPLESHSNNEEPLCST